MTKTKPPIALIAALGVLALLGTIVLMKTMGRSAPPAQTAAQAQAAAAAAPKTMRLVATRYIPPRTAITRAMLRTEETSKDAIMAGDFTDPAQAVGKLANLPILAGQPVTLASVTTTLQRAAPANFAIPSGMRAVAIYVDPNSTTAGLVDVGDRVDVIATNKGTVEKQDTDSYTQVYVGQKEFVRGRTIAQDLLVLAVDHSLNAPAPTPTPAPQAGGAPADGAPPNAAPTPAPAPTPVLPPGTVIKTRVILAATPQIAEHLAAANDGATLHVTIRDPNTHDQQSVPEAMEYPTKIYRVPKRKPAGAGGSRPSLSPPAMNTPVLPPMQTLPVQQPQQPVMTPGQPSLLLPSQPPAKEVTVIRGTEKTRVLIPR